MWLPPCLLFFCMRRHTFCPLSLPFASYVSGRASGGWARLGYASWSPFAFVGVVAVLISCSLRSLAWHVTYLDPTSHVCMLCMFSFCLCVLCVLCFTSVVCGLLHAFFSPLLVFCSPVVPSHTMLLVRGGDDLAAIWARTGIPFFPYLCGGGHRHSFRVSLLLVFLAGAVFVALFVAAHFGVAWYVTSFLVLRLLRRYAWRYALQRYAWRGI